MDVDRSLSAECFKQNRKFVFVHIQGITGIFNVLLDTGADFSVINKAIVDQHKLKIKPPKGPLFINLVDTTTSKRIGKVSIVVDILFPCSDRPIIARTKKTFEVLNISHDFIFGVDLLHSLFPDDELLDYTKLSSSSSTTANVTFSELLSINSYDDDIDNEMHNDTCTYSLSTVGPDSELPTAPMQPSMFSKKYKTALRHTGSQQLAVPSSTPILATESKPRTIASNYSHSIEKQMNNMEHDIQRFKFDSEQAKYNHYYEESMNQSSNNNKNNDDTIDNDTMSIEIINNDIIDHNDNNNNNSSLSDQMHITHNLRITTYNTELSDGDSDDDIPSTPSVSAQRQLDRYIAQRFIDQEQEEESDYNAAIRMIKIGDILGEDTLSLNDQTQDQHLLTEIDDVPNRPVSSTPEEQQLQYKPYRDRILKRLEHILSINEKLTGFCNHPDAILRFQSIRIIIIDYFIVNIQLLKHYYKVQMLSFNDGLQLVK